MAGKICVTGATGYVARHIVSQALDAGYVVMGTGRTAEKVYQLENEIRHPKFRVHNAELTAIWGWQAAMADCKAVVHDGLALSSPASGNIPMRLLSRR